MNRHSTLVSYLEKLLWLLTGNLGKPGAQYSPTSLANLVRTSRKELDPATGPRTNVTGAPVIAGLIPCNVIAEEILADHPQRFRAMIVESGNPAHSLADSRRMREAIEQLDVLVCIDVFMTETARLADYVLPALTQYEKHEATYFNFEFPRNVFHLRRPIVAAPDGPLPEPEIHARLCEAAGCFDDADLAPLRAAAADSRAAFGAAFAGRDEREPGARRGRAGRAVPHARRDAPRRRGERGGAVGARPALRAAEPRRGAAGRLRRRPARPVTGCSTPSSTARRASCSPTTTGTSRGSASRRRTASSTSPCPSCSRSWRRWPTRSRRATIRRGRSCCRPASAGRSRRTRSSATRPGASGTPRARCASAPADASALGLVDGAAACLTTRARPGRGHVAVDEAMQPGHLALPNGLGLDHVEADGRVRTGVAPNELTAGERPRPVGRHAVAQVGPGPTRPHPRAPRTQWLSHAAAGARLRFAHRSRTRCRCAYRAREGSLGPRRSGSHTL